LLNDVSLSTAAVVFVTDQIRPLVPQLLELPIDLHHHLRATPRPRLLSADSGPGKTRVCAHDRAVVGSTRFNYWWREGTCLGELLRELLDRGFHLRVLLGVATAFAAIVHRVEQVQHRLRRLGLVQLFHQTQGGAMRC
jgi:hypothetical protein